jgi:hypothetical protein
MSIRQPHVTRYIVALSALLGLATAAEAGPPLICHPFDAGTAQLLPWGQTQNWNSPDRSYDVKRLTADTLRLLSPDAPILARMENMRRATIYAGQDRAVAAELLAAVRARTLGEAGRGSRDALAWFDAGYLFESYRQAGAIRELSLLTEVARSSPKANPIDGYASVRKALEMGGPGPEIEFAASLMKEGTAAAKHRQRAVAGAKAGSLLAKNLQK